MGFARPQDDESGVGIVASWRQQQSHRHLGPSTRFVEPKSTNAVVHLIDLVHLLENQFARYSEYTTRDDVADFALGMDVDDVQAT